MTVRAFTIVFLILGLAIGLFSGSSSAATSGLPTPLGDAGQDPATTSKLQAPAASALQNAPVMFIENTGQFDPQVRFQMRGQQGTVHLTEDGIWYTLLEPPQGIAGAPKERGPLFQQAGDEDEARRGVNLKLSFAGANHHPEVAGFSRLDTTVSFFIGNDPARWQINVPVWGGVRYADLYPGIDLELTSQSGRLVQRVVVRPGADLDAVRLRVEGADHVTLEGKRLRLTTAVGEFSLPLLSLQGGTAGAHPSIVEPQPGRAEVSSPFASSPPPPSNPAQADDPSDLVYSTFLGGSFFGYEGAEGIAIDDSGAAYVAGVTAAADFPTEPGSFDVDLGGSSDAFVTKINADGSDLVYSTFLGGSAADSGSAIAVDSSGAAFVVGGTWSSDDFPTTEGAFDRTHNGDSDAFVAKLNSGGTDLVYSTLLGGGNADYGYNIAVDDSGAAYVTGETLSTNFPTTDGAYDTVYEYDDAFATKLNTEGSDLVYSTFLGGQSTDAGFGIAVDDSGAAYLAGGTLSSDFPTTEGAFDRTYEDDDAFVTKLNVDGDSLAYSTFLGGSGEEVSKGIAVGASGAAYITGATWSGDFPTTAGAFDQTLDGLHDAFIAKLNAEGSGLAYSTFLGGTSYFGDYSYAIAVDATGAACVTGETYSSDFPTTSGAFDTSYNALGDVFAVRLKADGGSLAYGSFLGGANWDYGSAIAIDGLGNCYVTGHTESSNFPTTVGAFDTDYNGEGDSFVAMVAMVKPTTINVDAYVQAPPLVRVAPGATAPIDIWYGNNGATTATSVTLTATLSISLTYVSDTSGITPTVGLDTVTWDLPDLVFTRADSFDMLLGVPEAELGVSYPLTLTLTSAGSEMYPLDNTATSEVMVTGKVYLPLILRNY